MNLIAGILLFIAQAQPAFVEGVVVTMGSGELLAGARVDLHPEKGAGDVPPREYIATTSRDGKFTLQGVVPGRYRLTATRTGYVPAEFGQRSATTQGIPFDLAAGQRLAGVQLAMSPTGSITGRVYDRDGEPLGKAEVQAVRAIYKDGRRQFTSVQTVETNDRGEYRLFWLTAGRYYVSAKPDISELAPAPMQLFTGTMSATRVTDPTRFSTYEQATSPVIRKRRLKNGTTIEETFIPTYHPGVTDAQSATPIAVGPGTTIGGIDISVAAGIVPARHIRGRVINGETGQLLVGAEVMAIPLAGGPSTTIPGNSSDAGGFDLAGATRGAYLVFASGNSLTGTTTVEVGDADLQNIAIVARPGFSISGRFIVEGPSRSRLEARMADLRVAQFVREPNLLGLSFGGPGFNPPPQPDGSFKIDGVQVGDYRLTLRGVPPDAYVRSMRMGGDDVLDGGLHLSGPPQNPLEIVIATDAGRLNGTVFNARQEPLANRTVVLVPDARLRHRSDLYKTVNTDQSGRFEMQGITPGTYQLFAWEEVETGAWRDPEFIRAYENRGKSVQVNPGSGESVQLTVIP